MLGISAPLSTTRRPREQGARTAYITDSQLAYWESTRFLELFAPVTPSELPDDLDWSEAQTDWVATRDGLSEGTSYDPVGTVHRASTSESEREPEQWGEPHETVYIPASLIDDYQAGPP